MTAGDAVSSVPSPDDEVPKHIRDEFFTKMKKQQSERVRTARHAGRACGEAPAGGGCALSAALRKELTAVALASRIGSSLRLRGHSV